MFLLPSQTGSDTRQKLTRFLEIEDEVSPARRAQWLRLFATELQEQYPSAPLEELKHELVIVTSARPEVERADVAHLSDALFDSLDLQYASRPPPFSNTVTALLTVVAGVVLAVTLLPWIGATLALVDQIGSSDLVLVAFGLVLLRSMNLRRLAKHPRLRLNQ